MKIKRIKVKRYKNLKDMECEFPDTNVIGFIGNNGAGKSNVLELITLMFSYAKKNFLNSRRFPAPVINDCEICYSKDNNEYTLIYNESGINLYNNKSEKVTKRESLELLPDSIFLYYSGETKRLSEIADITIDDKYKRLLINGKYIGYKYLDYFSIEDLDILLLTALVYHNELFDYIKPYLNGKDIYPEFALQIHNPTNSKDDGDMYYGAVGFVKDCFDRFRRYVKRTNYSGDSYFMYFDKSKIDQIHNIAEDSTDFFAQLKALKTSKYLATVHIDLVVDNNNNKPEIIELESLSEGEKQILLMLLLTKITAKNDILYLYDEFDSYMHLSWQKEFSHILSDLDVNGQILFTTHSPATISGLHKDSVFILEDGKVFNPLSDTYNRSLDEIIEEHLNVSLRREDFLKLQDKLREAVEKKDLFFAKEVLKKLQMILSEDDPYLIAAKNVIQRMEYYEAHNKE